MTVPVIALFNNKGGVGKTSVVYHLAWMFAELGLPTLAVDLDPQSNLTAAFRDEQELERLWSLDGPPLTIFGAIEPLLAGTGDVSRPHVEEIAPSLSLLPGDLRLSRFEDELGQQWGQCLDNKPRAFRVISAFWRVLQMGATDAGAGLALLDVGPNLGSLNRAALVATDHVVVPLSPDLFSLQGLRNLGPTLREWRAHWEERRCRQPPSSPTLELPRGLMRPAGYVVLQHAVRMDRPVRAYETWIRRIPEEYDRAILGPSQYGHLPSEPSEPQSPNGRANEAEQHEAPSPVPSAKPGDPTGTARDVRNDPHCLALLKHYRSLLPMAHEARKPIFRLTAADGAIGSHGQAVRAAHTDFESLARRIAREVHLSLADP